MLAVFMMNVLHFTQGCVPTHFQARSIVTEYAYQILIPFSFTPYKIHSFAVVCDSSVNDACFFVCLLFVVVVVVVVVVVCLFLFVCCFFLFCFFFVFL